MAGDTVITTPSQAFSAYPYKNTKNSYRHKKYYDRLDVFIAIEGR